ncbi:MAG TPA: MarR family transcriptional regulator [Stackebrandtia sp.]|uniref:MarR family winged helix-turn-helix transcriptional regulator n=1 Tax=Stackebrandtia sp. TaxID=2023065 RepID=UPI002D6B5DE4|nr:MarR family transcriptional regulator [Stackebrandtia sp.]HZE38057.1 MarR family transcriptional regulator [Stackebrandtia sp.]
MDTRELAADVNQTLRDAILLLRRVSADADISTPRLAVLGSLAENSRRMSELAHEHGVRLPTMTAQVNRLERDGLVERGRGDDDARVVTVAITERGREALRAGRAVRIDYLAERLSTLTASERRAIAAALPALARLSKGA